MTVVRKVKCGLKEDRRAILHELAKRMEIGGESRRIGHQALLVFAFGFAIKLFPPFADLDEAWHISDEHFDRFVIAGIHLAANDGVFISFVGL